MLTKTCEILTGVCDDRTHHSVCTFIDEIYLIGGNLKDDRVSTNTCAKYNPKENKCMEIGEMKIERSHATCSVLDGKIVAVKTPTGTA